MLAGGGGGGRPRDLRVGGATEEVWEDHVRGLRGHEDETWWGGHERDMRGSSVQFMAQAARL